MGSSLLLFFTMVKDIVMVFTDWCAYIITVDYNVPSLLLATAAFFTIARYYSSLEVNGIQSTRAGELPAGLIVYLPHQPEYQPPKATENIILLLDNTFPKHTQKLLCIFNFLPFGKLSYSVCFQGKFP